MPSKPLCKGKILVFGILFWYPLAGVTYQFLHYLLGLRRLGYDPYYIEDSGRWIYNPRSDDLSTDASENVETIAPILEAYGFANRWAFRSHYPGGRCYGMTEKQLLQLYREADAFLNVTGAQEIREEHLFCPRRIYVETDPVASQLAVAQGNEMMITALAQHDTHFSFGENLGAPDCGVPVERFHWLPTRQPILLDLWDNPFTAAGKMYNTIATWNNTGKDIVYRGETYYWSKAREFMKIIDLPHRCTVPFEIAAGVDAKVQGLLHEHGWSQVHSVLISEDMERYRTYIQCSRGEFTVAKDQNIRLRSGWFSDRSACYLAAGRPVITQDTGFGNILPTGRGLFSWNTLEDILAAIEQIENDYAGNCRAAREIAGEYFAAEQVLGSLMARAGL
ncbi:MAG: hypothetical protein U1F76_30855 [Candidatus Competibacteraceae bacterium]